MSISISSINYCPVKSISFQSIKSCEIIKNIGIVGDRIFAFSKGLDLNQAQLFEKKLEERRGKWNKILTLKNSPSLNKYNFLFDINKLTLTQNNNEILTINIDETSEYDLLSNKILELESSLQKPIYLMKNKDIPFFDTSISNKTILTHSISLINTKSVEDFQNKTNQEIETQRFRGNIFVDGVDAWEERNWVGKIIKINDISFKVEKNIPRCVAINLKPNTDDNSLNLLQSLKKTYNHFDMGVYLTALNNGLINIGDNISI
ncbi:MOSC domain-containing protein [Candidatus Pelagibacter sp.]|nr:MOSC domain-containing protein [Candidatus Pelagibacter sp.]